MNSQDNSKRWELGEGYWKKWEGGVTCRFAPNTPGVYAFRILKPTTLERAIGETDIAYIGSSRRSIHRRLVDHIKGRTDADSGRRIRRFGWTYKLEIAWKLFDSPPQAVVREAMN
jgi:hypothetical protein